MVLDILLPVRFHHRADGLTLLFFGVRYSAQLLRFLLILKKSYEAKGMSSIKEISFSGIDKAELEDEVHYDRVFHEHIVKGIMP
ncbi:MAG: hypothetical protein JST59_01285 [Actinobacteria bacterium]|nr:hypothetical protein [Actinomycetota bacterium]